MVPAAAVALLEGAYGSQPPLRIIDDRASASPDFDRMRVSWGSLPTGRDSRYRSGRCREWIKVKNRAHPAFERAMLIALSKHGGSRSR